MRSISGNEQKTPDRIAINLGIGFGNQFEITAPVYAVYHRGNLAKNAEKNQATVNYFRLAEMKKIFKKNQWFENKIKWIRRVSKPVAARASRVTKKFGSLGMIIIVFGLTITGFLLPKDRFQNLKEKIIAQPESWPTHLELAQQLLDNQQFNLAENEIRVLGSQTNQQIEELKKTKAYSNPQEIRLLINSWEEIVAEKPDYRDGYLQLAYLHFRLYQNDQARQYLAKALALDPNFPLSLALEKLLL